MSGTVDKRKLGQFEVSSVAFGCMSLSHGYGKGPAEDYSIRLLNRALDLGCNFLDTASLYGFGANEELLAKAVMHRRDEFVLASKCVLFRGPDGKRAIDGSPAAIKRTCEESLRRLKTDVIDLYYLHRLDRKVPIEDSVGAMADLVAEGKIRMVGLSEMSAATLRRAQAVHPIAAMQSEYSLWTRNAEIAVLDACRELGVAFVAFSPVGRGFLTGKLTDVSAFEENDIRRSMPRFEPENYAANLRLLDRAKPIAARAGLTLTQMAIGWLLAKAPHLVVLPGSARIEHMEEDLAAGRVVLDAATVAELDALFTPDAIAGARYNAAGLADTDMENFD